MLLIGSAHLQIERQIIRGQGHTRDDSGFEYYATPVGGSHFQFDVHVDKVLANLKSVLPEVNDD